MEVQGLKHGDTGDTEELEGRWIGRGCVAETGKTDDEAGVTGTRRWMIEVGGSQM